MPPVLYVLLAAQIVDDLRWIKREIYYSISELNVQRRIAQPTSGDACLVGRVMPIASYLFAKTEVLVFNRGKSVRCEATVVFGTTVVLR